MKQLLRTLLLSFIVLSGAAFNMVFAQTASTYVYTYSTPTYAAITGTSIVTGTSSWNDDVYTGIPIGFTFYFEGQPYTSVGVSSNGFIWFGSGTVTNTITDPISAASLGTGTINGVVCGYGAYLLAYPSTLKSSPTGAPEISYTTTGSPCSQVFTVQWKGAYVSGTSTGEIGGDLNRVDLQIVLDQTTNAISILLHVNPYPYDNSSSGEVGIRGAANTDFTSLTCWTAGCSQTTNNAATGTLNPNYPATKSEFTFTPPACSYTSVTTSTNPTCGSNGTITITPTGAGPYTYIINNGVVADTNTTGAFTGLAAGNYTSEVTNGSCVITACATLTSSVSTPTASNTGPVCSGGTVTLSTPTVSGATYGWIGPNGFTSSQQDTVITVTAADTGIYTVFDTVGGCASGPGTTNVTLSAAPAAPGVSSNSPVCVGGTLTLTDSVSGAKYTWTGPNSFTSAVQDPSISGVVIADSGTYTVVDTVSGCASAPATVHVVVNSAAPAPVVGSNSPVCLGATLTLGDSTSGAKYTWTGPNSFTSNVQDPTRTDVVAADSGTYTVVDTVSGCASLPATVHVVISSAPAAPGVSSNSPLCTGATLNLVDSVNGVSYSWTGPNSFTSSVQDPTRSNVVAADSGTYTVVDTVNGCTSLPATVHVVINATLPAPNVGSNSPLCVGGTLTLTDSTSGATYGWTGPNSFASAAQDPTITNVSAIDSGTYSVVDTVSGCPSLPATIHVAINPIPATPVAGSNSPLCVGSTLSLADSTGAAAYSWTGPNGFTSSSQDTSIANVVVTDSGTYTVTNTVSGCASAPASVHVIINPMPAAPGVSNNSPVCVGGTLTLTDSVNGATYSWTGPNSFSSGLQDPTIASVVLSDSGLYTVVDTVAGCASAPATTHVVVNPLPTQPIVGSNSPLCTGQELDLTVVSQTAATYSWSGPNGFVSGTQDPDISGVSAADSGYYVVTVTLGSCGSTVDSTLVTIRPNTGVVVSNSGPVCAGEPVIVSATVVNGAIYSWTGPDGFSSSQSSDTISDAEAINAGQYILSVSNGVCGASTDTTVVVVNPVPTTPSASSNSPLCPGSNLDLNVVAQPGATYSWSGPNGFVAGIGNPTIDGVTSADSGNYVVTVTQGTCGSLSDTILVVINPAPPAVIATNNGPICTGQTLQLNVTAVANATYNWSGPESFGNSSQAPSITGIDTLQAGTYYVTVTNSCGSSIDSTIVSVVTSAIPPVLSSNSPLCIGNELTLSSNPISGATFVWSGPNGFSATGQDAYITNVQVSDSGIYTLADSVPGCGTASASIDIVVNIGLPTPAVSSNSPVCQGDTLKLSGQSGYAGSTNYSWLSPADTVISISSSAFVPNMNSSKQGTYYYYVVSGGCTGIDSVSVVVNPLPIIKLPSSNYCNGDSAVLNVGGGYESYHWSNGSMDSSIVIHAADTSIISSVTVTNFSGCSAHITVTSVFLAKPDTIVINQNGDILTSSWSNALDYQWYAGGNIINGATTNTLLIDSSGYYSILVTDSNGCSSTSAVDYLIATGINSISGNNDHLLLYPNPASENIFLSASGTIDTYVIYNVEGQEIARREDIKAQNTAIDLHGWAKGVYFLQATMGQQTVTLRFAVME